MARIVHDAGNLSALPGRLARAEGDPPTGDEAVDETYDGLGATYSLFWDVYALDFLDGRSSKLPAVVHYERAWNNTAWNGQWLLVGDGDNHLFNRFSNCIEIIGHELTHAVISAQTPLTFWGESGTLSESIADVFGSLVKQYLLGQTATEADWLIGAGLLADGVHGIALRSMSEPGTAYDDRLLGKDSQPAHMRDFVRTTSDNGGIHINTGIPNRAFYLVATALGGYAWERAGRIWYESLRDPQLHPDARLGDFADVTHTTAQRLYSELSDEALAVKYGWDIVGVNPSQMSKSQ
jgi:Zn-dependent metalloprotease